MSKVQRKNSLFHAYDEAQRIAFGPVTFQATAASIDLGILKALSEGPESLSIEALAQRTQQTPYGVRVLVELLSTAHVVTRHADETYSLSKTGECLLFDEMTRVNFNFIKEVNYAALAHTTTAIVQERPAGLAEFDPSWKTIYPHLKDLPVKARQAWFEFDHYYSDVAYRAALNILKTMNVQHFCDIGGNTGKFTKMALETLPNARATFVDLPEQIELMKANPQLKDVHARINAYAIDWLDCDSRLTINEKADLIWMSQFLDCFSFEEALSILIRAQEALTEDGRIAILEPLWDAQPIETASLCLAATSLYFTVLANGNSRFFGRNELEQLISNAGLEIESRHDHLGVSHSLYVCRKVSVK